MTYAAKAWLPFCTTKISGFDMLSTVELNLCLLWRKNNKQFVVEWTYCMKRWIALFHFHGSITHIRALFSFLADWIVSFACLQVHSNGALQISSSLRMAGVTSSTTLSRLTFPWVSTAIKNRNRSRFDAHYRPVIWNGATVVRKSSLHVLVDGHLDVPRFRRLLGAPFCGPTSSYIVFLQRAWPWT